MSIDRSRSLIALMMLVIPGLASSCSPAPKRADWHLDAITAMKTPADPPLVCPVTIPADTHAAERSSCAFSDGATAADTLGIPPDVARSIPIRHVIVVMRENRSFDHLWGPLAVDGQPAATPIPASFANPDLLGETVTPYRQTTTCLSADPAHQWAAMHTSVHDGAMNGFVGVAASTTGTDGHFSMSYYDGTLLPFQHWVATTWSISDAHFSSARAGTYPNRDFLLLGTTDGVYDGSRYPSARTPSIFLSLMNAGFTWGVYGDGALLSGALGWQAGDPGTHTFARFLADIDAGTLPNVVFVDGIDYVEDDHPPADLQVGEAWLRNVYQHAVKSPLWPRLALVVTYDEAGGYADHVAPSLACIARPMLQDLPFFERGPRVPLAVISPYSRPRHVSHVVHDHTAITRLVETIFGLGALTARDANSDALLDMFDFSCDPPMLTPPDAPAAGTGGCN